MKIIWSSFGRLGEVSRVEYSLFTSSLYPQGSKAGVDFWEQVKERIGIRVDF